MLLAGGYVSAARQTAAAGGLPLDAADLNKPASANLATPSGQEAMTYDVVRKAKSDINGAAIELRAVEASLGKERAGFASGQLALQSAKRLQMPQALQWFEKADPAQLTSEQWEWWTRSALRTRQWQEVERITRLMPAEVADKPARQYWRARSLKQLGRTSEATSLFVKASQGHHYYALLSLEEIGNSLSTPASRINPDEASINRLQNQPGIRRALALFNLSERYRKPEFRTDAQREWRWSMRGRRDADLLAAAELARRQGFYDMAIYSAERTQTDHDFSLRYLTPYREVTQRYAKQLGIDDALGLRPDPSGKPFHHHGTLGRWRFRPDAADA
ncbi:hypothetical protein [Paludibacterium denitrificans]|uniref:hypothetical protein n=1 Tax=Paludibacterium denitrificans TaxID=2675226 RepID=UPI001E28DFD8|nr:hypothetical protein [Paludibacterium denitrificans]